MEKRKPSPLPEAKPAKPAEPDASVKIAEALRGQSENSLIVLEVSQAIREQMNAELGDHAKKLQAIVDRITATREVDVEVTRRDENGKIAALRIRSSLPKTILH